MAEEMNEGTEELPRGPSGARRTIERQVDYGKSMYASGKADGAREAHQALEPLKDALRKVYLLVASAYDSDRFGAQNADEVKELRREVAGVLGTVGIASLADGRVYPELDPCTRAALEEREAVVAALERRQLFLAEHFARPDVELRHQEVDELLRIVHAGEHRKGDTHV